MPTLNPVSCRRTRRNNRDKVRHFIDETRYGAGRERVWNF
jgi:hypothetical protein